MQVQHFLAICFLTVVLSLVVDAGPAVEGHAANCTTQEYLNITCMHPNVSSIVMLVLNGTVFNTKESFTGTAVFSVPYSATVNVFISCRVKYTCIHNSTPFTVDEQGKQCVWASFLHY